uniref:CSON001814 protein n=1 Tax=Culicoides sonorensis TaxID=179676 RepID=A0A336KBM3_CULSO
MTDTNETAQLDHDYLHENMHEIIANGVMSQYSSLIRSSLDEKECLACALSIIHNYPAIESWSRWTGFDDFEEYAFKKAVSIAPEIYILTEQEISMQHWPLLFRAVSNDHISFVKHIINKCPEVLSQECANDNVFKFALILGRHEILHYLLDLLTTEGANKYSKHLKLGVGEFVAACNSSECPLSIIKFLLDIVVKSKEIDWEVYLFQGIQMMIFKQLDILQELLVYFFDKFPSDTSVLYEVSKYGDVMLFSIALDMPSLLTVIERAPKSVEARDRHGKTLLMKAVEIQNSELVKSLIKNFKLNINDRDNLDQTALNYAISEGNPFIIQFLIENGAKLHGTFNLDNKIESRLIRCDPEEIMNFTISALQNEISIEVFANVLKCLYNSAQGCRWPWFRNEQTRKLFFPVPSNNEEDDSKLKERFREIYKILYQLKIIEKCPNIFDAIMMDMSVSLDQKIFAIQGPSSLLQIQMSLMLDEPQLEYPCCEMYETKEFDLIKDYLNIETFNEVVEGREIPSLKRYCREVIRKQINDRIIKLKLYELDDFDLVLEDTYDSLSLPKTLVNFLRYQY